MSVFLYISDLIVPVLFMLILLFGYAKKVDLYDTFVEGAKEGLITVFHILPTLIGLMVAVAVLRDSGALDFIVGVFEPFSEVTGFPAQLMPLSLMRLFSSSAATGIVLDLFAEFGPDSFIGRVASVILGSTETVFYTMSVYFMSIGIKNTRYTLAGAIFANVVGIGASFFIVLWLFGR